MRLRTITLLGGIAWGSLTLTKAYTMDYPSSASLPDVASSPLPMIASHPVILEHPEYASYPETVLPLKIKVALQIMHEIITGKRPNSDLQKLDPDTREFVEIHPAYQSWHKQVYGDYTIPNYMSLPKIASVVE